MDSIFMPLYIYLLRITDGRRSHPRLHTNVSNAPTVPFAAADLRPKPITEGLFSAANIFSSLKLVYIFSVNPHLGPLQVSLSRMVMDIIKFFFLYVLVLFAFSSGLNQLLWWVKRNWQHCLVIHWYNYDRWENYKNKNKNACVSVDACIFELLPSLLVW